jgi:hypothetical protein
MPFSDELCLWPPSVNNRPSNCHHGRSAGSINMSPFGKDSRQPAKKWCKIAVLQFNRVGEFRIRWLRQRFVSEAYSIDVFGSILGDLNMPPRGGCSFRIRFPTQLSVVIHLSKASHDSKPNNHRVSDLRRCSTVGG